MVVFECSIDNLLGREAGFVGNAIMDNMLAMFIDLNEDASVAFVLSAVFCLVLSFLIIACARSLGNKLLMLGVLLALTAFMFTATMPMVIPLAFGMVAMAVLLVLTGIID